MTTAQLTILATALVLVSASSKAECWLLKNGQIVVTSANSTPPEAGAKRVTCPPPLVAKPPAPAPKLGVVTTILGTGPKYTNCVLYARSRVKTLPSGLFNWDAKLKAVNSHSPAAGSIAMIPYQQEGHVAYVEKISGNTITIIEANFSSGKLTRRVSTGSSLADAEGRLKIVGYFRP